jgi:small subunit ribosomal protein S6
MTSDSEPQPPGQPNAITPAAASSPTSFARFPHRTRATPEKALLRPGSPPRRCYRGAPLLRLYDLMLLLDPNAPDDRHREILGNVNAAIEGKGKLVGQHDWGMRRMAYEIEDRTEAAYHLFQFEAEGGELLEQLENTLKITDGVLRHRIIKVKPGTPAPPTPRPEAPRGAREPEDAAGTVAARAAADAPPAPAAEPAEEPEQA